MTFIATVRARNGLAVIADSLVTTEKPVLELEVFKKYIESIKSNKKAISIDFDEIEKLFESKPHHTNDFEDKLIQYDPHTAITTAGDARINGKRISDIVKEKILINHNNQQYEKMLIEEKVRDFGEYIKEELRSEQSTRDSRIVFIISHFDIINLLPVVYETVCTKTLNEKGKFEVESNETLHPEHMKVICDGQNSIAYRVLYGNALYFGNFVKQLLEHFRIELSLTISEEDFTKCVASITGNIYDKIPELLDEISAFKIQELSIQQAVDLAYLLLKVEMDFQKYTEDIPTIGGVIKIATITQEGFKFLCGQDIEKPL